MSKHRLEVADVFGTHQQDFLQRWGHVVSRQQRKVLRDIGRTAALGTHLERCDRCNYETVAYDSCRNRHCPKCQSTARDRWLLERAASLLPVPYAHVVFTLPEQLAPLALRNQRLFYNLLFRAAAETLLVIAADPAISAHASAYWQCCTRGLRLCGIIPTSIVSSPAAVSPSTTPAGSQLDAGSFYPCECSAASSAASCWPSSSRLMPTSNYASPELWPYSPSQARSTPCYVGCAIKSGWSTPSLPSEVPSMC